MAHCLRALIVVLVLLGISRQATAQPVDLGIPNVPQETDVWCWAAVAEQIIRWRNLAAVIHSASWSQSRTDSLDRTAVIPRRPRVIRDVIARESRRRLWV